MATSILIIQNDKDLNKYLKDKLTNESFKVKVLEKGVRFASKMKDFLPDIVVLDWDLSEIEGEQICDDINTAFPEIPIIVISSQENVKTLTKAFRKGAVDFISKPFNVQELIIRVRARLKRIKSRVLEFRDLKLDNKRKEFYISGEKVNLTKKEFRLMKYLLRNRKRTVTRDMILSRVWNTIDYVEPRIVDVYIGYLRKKLEENNSEVNIKTKRGFGYALGD